MNEMMKKGLYLVASTGIKEITKEITNIYIKPKIECNFKSLKLHKRFDLIENNFNEYMERMYNNYLYMNTIVFKNQQKTINDLYIPLTVVQSKTIRNSHRCEICINEYRDKFIPTYKKVLLVDNAGMGKSTIIKYLYLSAITYKKGIPILIELRRLDRSTSIVDFIMNEINNIRDCLNKEDFFNLVERGDFIFFFDGYDEITEESKQKVTENLQEFIYKTSNNMFIISSRDESELSCFGDFQRFDIKPLKKEEAYALIRKYDNDGELSKELIEKLENEKNLKIIDEFLVNPLMVSLLYKAFEYKRTVPYKKHIFYRQVYDALFQDHDKSKGGAYVHPKKSRLDIDDFHRVLRTIGFITLVKGITYSKEEFTNIIKKAKEIAIGTEFKESDFINDVIYSVPIFVKEGIEYRWLHKSFQEYFAASYICFDSKEKQGKYLLQMISKEKIQKYYNVLDFCYDMDYKQFRRIAIYNVINDYINYYNNAYTSDKFKNYNPRFLDTRKSIMYVYKDIKIENFFGGYKKTSSEYKATIGIVNDENLNSGTAISFKYDYTNSLLKLLLSKQSRIINQIYERKIIIPEFIKNKNEKYIIDENPKSILNKNEKNFNLTTEFLYNISCLLHTNFETNQLIFDYDECVKLKDKIEDEIKSEEEEILL
ncbi:NACHT domain-containing protein [Clostridium botulinum]